MISHFLLGLALAAGQVGPSEAADNWESAQSPTPMPAPQPAPQPALPTPAQQPALPLPAPQPAPGKIVVSPEELKALIDAGVQQRLRANQAPVIGTTFGLTDIVNYQQLL